jgi:DNA-binding XRE family transcriptional regulator
MTHINIDIARMVVGRNRKFRNLTCNHFLFYKECFFMTGLEIKVARIKAGLKGYELASKLGITPDKMSQIEVGRFVPDEDFLNKILAAINEAQAK